MKAKKKRTTTPTTARKRAPRKARGSSPLRMQTERVKLNRGGYDARGKYWGAGEKLWRVSVIDVATDIYVDEHVRAPTQRDAKSKVTAHMMKALSLLEASGGRELSSGEKLFKAHHTPHRVSASERTHDSGEGQWSHEPINLEGSTDTELLHLTRNRKAHPQLRELAGVFRNARDARLRGMIDSALQYEGRAQALYDKLPTHLRW
jgi:hypothetical protein